MKVKDNKNKVLLVSGLRIEPHKRKVGTCINIFGEVDMSPIFEVRKEYKEIFKRKLGVGLGSFFTSAVVRALEL